MPPLALVNTLPRRGLKPLRLLLRVLRDLRFLNFFMILNLSVKSMRRLAGGAEKRLL